MNHLEHSPKTPRVATGRFGVLGAPHGGQGNGAPRAGARVRVVTLVAGRPWRLAAGGLLCALVGALVFASAPAQAVTSHVYLSQITEVPAKGPPPAEEPVPLPGQLGGEFYGMTVDLGHLWVTDQIPGESGLRRVDKFDAGTGGFISQFVHTEKGHSPINVALGHAKGEPGPQVYVVEAELGAEVVGIDGESGTRQATWTGAGTPPKSFSQITDIAVDNSVSPLDWAAGDVYVVEHGRNVVDVLRREPNGEEYYVTQLPEPEPEPGVHVPFQNPYEVAVDESNGEVFVADDGGSGGIVDEFEPTVLDQYAFVRQLKGTPAGSFGGIYGVAVDSVDGDIYVALGGEGVVDEFDSAGVYLGHLTGTPSGPFTAPEAVAVDPESHDVYVGDQLSGVDIFGPNVVTPDVTTAPVFNLKAHGATLEGTVNPDEAGPATCSFIYGPSPSELTKTAECEGAGSEATPILGHTGENSPVTVHAELSGLEPDTTYYYRLQASNANGANPGEASQDQHFTTTGPGIREPSVSRVTSTSSTLDAAIDPNNASTSYYFQYGTSASYGSSVPAPPGASAGSGVEALSVSVHLQGLSPGTVYHYRIVALSEPGGEPVTVESPDLTFTTQGPGSGTSLPDGRQYEMVTPPNKHGAGIYPIGQEGGSDIQAAAGGDGITFAATAPFAANPRGSRAIEKTQVLSKRTAPGIWETADITTPHNEGTSQIDVGFLTEYLLFSSDLSLGIVEPKGDTPLPPLPAGSEKTVYARHNGQCAATSAVPTPASCYQALVSAANVPEGTEFGGAEEIQGGVAFASASPDLGHVVLKTEATPGKPAPSLTQTAVPQGGLYEWAADRPASEPFQLVDILPPHAGKPEEPAAAADLGYEGHDVRHAISNDGSRVIWSATENSKTSLYMRDMVREETLQIGGNGATFEDANAEGSRVFFSGQVCEIKINGVEKLECVVTSLGGTVLGASKDGSYVYFVGANNLYVEHYDEATRAWEAPRFIATLAGGDSPDFSDGNGNLASMTSRVSPNGRYLAFMSERSLTGYDNRDANSGVPDEEVFEYHAPENIEAEPGSLVCASCDPTGARPLGLFEHDVTASGGPDPSGPLVDYSEIWSGGGIGGSGRWLAGNVVPWTLEDLSHALYQSRYLSDSGRLFFDFERWAGAGGRERQRGRVRVRAGGRALRQSLRVLACEHGRERRLRARSYLCGGRPQWRIGRGLCRFDLLGDVPRRIGVPGRLGIGLRRVLPDGLEALAGGLRHEL